MRFSRLKYRLRRLLLRVFGRRDSAVRIARGMAAGFFAAAFPLPGLQIPLSVLFAWIARGNKFVSIFPQFISNAGTMLPLAVLQYEIGMWLWPAKAVAADAAMAAMRAIVDEWAWTSPWQSLGELGRGLGSLGLSALGPLALGVVLTGAVMAVTAYPLTLVGVWSWRARREGRRLARRRRGLGAVDARGPGPQLSCPEALMRYARRPELFQRAAAVRLLVDGRQAYPEMIATIEAATTSVDFETYMIKPDRTGRRFADALIRASQDRGVRVRLLYDYIGSLGMSAAFVQELLAAGVAVAVYHPLVWTRPTWALNRRDHRKMLIIDGAITFTGGLNIADEYAAPEDGGGGWRDTHVRLDGAELAATAVRLFNYAWRSAVAYEKTRTKTGRLLAAVQKRLEPQGGPAAAKRAGVDVACDPSGVAVQLVGNREFGSRHRIRLAYLHAIRNARSYIFIENAYFIPDRTMRRALCSAARRGVTVAVAVARDSDFATCAYAGRHLFGRLLRSGVRLYEWPLGMLHAKTAVIDDAWAIVGSYNFDHRSLFHQLEAVALIASPVFARSLREQTLADFAQCRELLLSEHMKRSWRRILMESAAYLLRHWL